MSASLSPALNAAPVAASTRRKAKASEAPGTQAFRFKQTLKEARTGLIEAQYQVGLMLATGAGTRKNLGDALVWMTRAAERGHAGAQFMLGCHYGADPGTAPRGQVDEARALDWLYLASRQGHPRAHHRLAHLIRQSGAALAAHHEATAASLGLADSQLALAREQLRPDADTDLRNSGKAWLRRAAEQGLPAAQTALGLACLDPSVAGASPEEGLAWLQAAAQQAWPPALLELHRRGLPSPALPQPIQDPVEPAARHALGELHARGAAGLPVHLQQASHWFSLAASQGHAPAHTALGHLAAERDPEAALRHYEAGANQGDREAQHALSCALRAAGRSNTEQLSGQRWLVMAAEAGHPQALLEWSELLQRQDPALAQVALRRAAEAGLPEAQVRIARQLLASPASEAGMEALHWLEAAAAQGHPEGLGRLGLLLCGGTEAVRDLDRGLRCLQKAADADDPGANWHLALMLAAGKNGLPQDPAAALTHCRRAADTGFTPALATLGVLCATLERAEEAVFWWRQAAQAGDMEAQFNLAQALQSGRGVAHDESQAFQWLLKAAQAGLPQAQVELGILYATGRGVAQDPIEAHTWFVLARLGGSLAARHNAERSHQQLRPDQREEAERRARSWRVHQRRHD